MVVGKPGITSPAKPRPTSNNPKEKYSILEKSICLIINFIQYKTIDFHTERPLHHERIH